MSLKQTIAEDEIHFIIKEAQRGNILAIYELENSLKSQSNFSNGSYPYSVVYNFGTEFSRERKSFFFNSYIEDYYSWAGHGYHIHLSSRDANYLSGLGTGAAGTAAGALAALGLLSGGASTVLGFIIAFAIGTVFWREQNSDGSLDIWSPDMFRKVGIPLFQGTSLGTVKIGSNWYPVGILR